MLKNSFKHTRFDKKHFVTRSILSVKFNSYKDFFRLSGNYQLKSATCITFISAKCIGSPWSPMMIVLYRVVSCDRPDRATAAIAMYTSHVYLDC